MVAATIQTWPRYAGFFIMECAVESKPHLELFEIEEIVNLMEERKFAPVIQKAIGCDSSSWPPALQERFCRAAISAPQHSSDSELRSIAGSLFYVRCQSSICEMIKRFDDGMPDVTKVFLIMALEHQCGSDVEHFLSRIVETQATDVSEFAALSLTRLRHCNQ